ncbi:hypothetical protein FRC01_006362 [Tulasnella sp. 417]|nr:hypothetical protein FRC01_006362 [Tulasnella sp. 417]
MDLSLATHHSTPANDWTPPNAYSVASYLAPSFQLSTKAVSTSSSKAKQTPGSAAATDNTEAIGTMSEFSKVSAAAGSANYKSTKYRKAFELLGDGTDLVESLIEAFGRLSLSDDDIVLESRVEGKGKDIDRETIVDGREPATSEAKPLAEPKQQRAGSTPVLVSVAEQKPVSAFFSRTQSAPASRSWQSSAQSDDTVVPRVPVQRKVSATSLPPKAPVIKKSSRNLNNNGSNGSGTRSRTKSSSRAAVTPPDTLEDTTSVISEAPSAEEPKSKNRFRPKGRARTSRPKKIVVDPTLPSYTYKDPELALAFTDVEPPYDGSEEEPKKKPIEPARWYITSSDEANDALTGLKGPVGFDMEWVVVFRRGAIPRKTALIQIADRTKIMLFHVSRMSEFPSKLIEVIEDPDIIKTGVNITGDAKKLFTDWGIQAQGIVELATLAWQVDRQTMESNGIKTGWTTLANMVGMYLGRVLPKGAERTSNWEKPLDELQMEYAANDAHCGLAVYEKLQAKAEAAKIDMSTLSLNRRKEEQVSTTEPTDVAESDTQQEAEDAYADLVLASTDTESEPASTSDDEEPVAPPCPPTAKPFRYKAYKLWYECPELTLDEMCIHLRSAAAPLARSTVIDYVVKTLRDDSEKTLPFSKDRLIKLVSEEPKSWRWNYKRIVGLEST